MFTIIASTVVAAPTPVAAVGVVLAVALLASLLLLVCMADRGEDDAGTHRQRGIDAYARFLAGRDGKPDLLRHTLSAREDLFARLAAEPVASTFRPDAEQYRRSLVHGRSADALDARLLWLIATAKSNQAERFAVGLAEVYGRLPIEVDDRILLHIHLQETYHTRLLAEVVTLFGLPVQPRPPAMPLRFFIKSLVFAPPEWVLPLTGASEMVGCVLFRTMRDIGCRLFRDEPAVAERIRVLYDQILADEIGHVGYVAARLGPRRRTLMRTLYAFLGPRMVAQMPELRALCPADEWKQRLSGFNLKELVDESHGLAYAAAMV